MFGLPSQGRVERQPHGILSSHLGREGGRAAQGEPAVGERLSVLLLQHQPVHRPQDAR